jgi:hypothetical protein
LGLLRVPITFGIAAGLLTAGLVIDLLREAEKSNRDVTHDA